MASALLNALQYNPMQANTVDRLNYISYYTQKFDIVTLVGTKAQHEKYMQVHVVATQFRRCPLPILFACQAVLFKQRRV